MNIYSFLMYNLFSFEYCKVMHITLVGWENKAILIVKYKGYGPMYNKHCVRNIGQN